MTEELTPLATAKPKQQGGPNQLLIDLGPVIIYASLTVPGVMLLEATLSFLGLGIQPPDASWGVLIREGADSMETYPWMLAGPGLFFSATLLALNLLGDALRDALDPKSGG